MVREAGVASAGAGPGDDESQLLLPTANRNHFPEDAVDFLRVKLIQRRN